MLTEMLLFSGCFCAFSKLPKALDSTNDKLSINVCASLMSKVTDF